jgi:hypothetical protein
MIIGYDNSTNNEQNDEETHECTLAWLFGQKFNQAIIMILRKRMTI